MPYARELIIAEEAARAAGGVLRELRGRGLNVREKADRSLVTDADLAAEAEVLGRLQEAFPQDGILSEEAGLFGPTGGRQWIVDPLDGTSNYARGLPFFTVSIALWDGGRPAVAALYMPVMDELFLATRETESTLNGEPIRVSRIGAIEDAMINVYFDRHERLEEGLETFRRVALRCEGRVKTIGSSASLLCYVACGRLDGFIRNRIKVWDFAAGILVAQQAGATVTDFDGEPLVRTGQSLLATNGLIHAQLSEAIGTPDLSIRR
jgi:myo-inositol-1(or 4)-monophosphatase